LINLPDLYHEIAHFIYNSYASYFYDIIEVWVQTHFTDEIERVDDENRDEKLKDIFSQSMKKWRENWIEEFMCDIIATYLVGTAYAWTNFKITILSSGNDEVYTDTEEHPSDESRMRVIFHVLSAMNADNVMILKDKWQDFLRITDNNKPDNYDNIFPEKLLKNIAEKIILQLDQTGLNSWKVQLEKSDKPVIWYLNQAWEILLNSPEKYAEKQAEMIREIHDLSS